jgi:hypothetical protein
MRFSGIAKASKVAILVLFPAAVNPLHFVPHIRAPKFLLNGLFLLMREPRNRASFIGTAIFRQPEVAVPLINAFLDETLGPVSRKSAHYDPGY